MFCCCCCFCFVVVVLFLLLLLFSFGGGVEGGGGEETGRESGKRGVARLCVCGCACVPVWMQGRDKVRYVMHY